jgi:MFS family permease
MSYVRELCAELERVGIPRRLRVRILAEISDHLTCDPEAPLGRPAELAYRFADELGTRRARRASLEAFVALAIAAAAFAAAFLSSGVAGPNATNVYASSALLGYVGTVLVLGAPQLALVAGSLAALRAFRCRDDPIIPRSEAVVIGRRSAVGLAAGLASMAGLVLVALQFQGRLAGWWTTLALAAAVIGSCALATALPAVWSALRLRPVAHGEAGDVFDDLDGLVPLRLRGHPWRLAGVTAAAVALVITLAGVAQSDGIDGALRGIADGLACLAGFALLGRCLGLRRVAAR